jgi:beta-galactosidase
MVIWSMVESSPRALSDFSWTSWDYLGEAGLGTWTPGKRIAAMAKPYPHITADTGTIDITGAGRALALPHHLPGPRPGRDPLDRYPR